jgi:hypothetical protein
MISFDMEGDFGKVNSQNHLKEEENTEMIIKQGTKFQIIKINPKYSSADSSAQYTTSSNSNSSGMNSDLLLNSVKPFLQKSHNITTPSKSPYELHGRSSTPDLNCKGMKMEMRSTEGLQGLTMSEIGLYNDCAHNSDKLKTSLTPTPMEESFTLNLASIYECSDITKTNLLKTPPLTKHHKRIRNYYSHHNTNTDLHSTEQSMHADQDSRTHAAHTKHKHHTDSNADHSHHHHTNANQHHSNHISTHHHNHHHKHTQKHSHNHSQSQNQNMNMNHSHKHKHEHHRHAHHYEKHRINMQMNKSNGNVNGNGVYCESHVFSLQNKSSHEKERRPFYPASIQNAAPMPEINISHAFNHDLYFISSGSKEHKLSASGDKLSYTYSDISYKSPIQNNPHNPRILGNITNTFHSPFHSHTLYMESPSRFNFYIILFLIIFRLLNFNSSYQNPQPSKFYPSTSPLVKKY